MGGRTEHPLLLAMTTVLSHVAMIPSLRFLHQQGFTYELGVSIFATIASFMYHLAESFDATLLLTEGQWHRLDNIGIIGVFGLYFSHLCCLRNPIADAALKQATFFVTLVLQEKDPWNEWYTIGPVLGFAVMPITAAAWRWRTPPFNWLEVMFGFGLLTVALPFFVWGLDDQNDPFRVYHAIWHVAGGYGSYRLWQVVPNPVARAARRQLNAMPPHDYYHHHHHEGVPAVSRRV